MLWKGIYEMHDSLSQYPEILETAQMREKYLKNIQNLDYVELEVLEVKDTYYS